MAFPTVLGVALSKVAKRVWEEIRADDVVGRSAQLAYYCFLALFPFLIFVVSSLSVIGSADRGRALIFQFLAQALPSPAFQLIHQTFEQIIRTSGPLRMSVGIVACIWSTSMGMGAVMDTLNAAYKLNETRPLLRQYFVAIQLTITIRANMEDEAIRFAQDWKEVLSARDGRLSEFSKSRRTIHSRE